MVVLGERGQESFDTSELIRNIKEDMSSYMLPYKLLDALSYIRWMGYGEDKGLGARLQGIVDPLNFVEKKDTFGLGYVADGPTIKHRKIPNSL